MMPYSKKCEERFMNNEIQPTCENGDWTPVGIRPEFTMTRHCIPGPWLTSGSQENLRMQLKSGSPLQHPALLHCIHGLLQNLPGAASIAFESLEHSLIIFSTFFTAHCITFVTPPPSPARCIEASRRYNRWSLLNVSLHIPQKHKNAEKMAHLGLGVAEPPGASGFSKAI